MTESDQRWLKAEFDRVHGVLSDYKEQCDKRIGGVEKWITNVEKKTETNSRFIWMVTGGLVLLGTIVGIFAYTI